MPETKTTPPSSAEKLDAVRERAKALYDRLHPIARRFEFDPPPRPNETSGPPLVLFLGNHSSGKSSFVNHLLGAEIQKTGLAPTDDGFTIITHGDARAEKDGQSVVSDPRLPYTDLERFGPVFRSHLRLKMVPHDLLRSLSLVDSPGMIDTVSEHGERGYDFAAGVRWFGERADVIVFMFDPDKPGTTGETLDMLRTALEGLDHKLLIVLNKVDRFRDIHDFARTYGALCWNLSKVLLRKDLPHVFNIYVPVPDREEADGALPTDAFDRARDEVVAEIRRAPSRRVDNIVSRLYDYARRLRIQALVCDRARRDISEARARWVFLTALALVAAGAVGWLAWTSSVGWGVAIGATAVGAAAVLAVLYWMRVDLRQREKAAIEGLDGVFERALERELALSDRASDLRGLWRSVRGRAHAALAAVRPGNIPRLRGKDRRTIERAIATDIPALR